MPALIVENGTIVPDANSYATLEQIRTYAAGRGIELPADDEIVSTMAIRGMDYVGSFATRFKGIRTDLTQWLDWPRTGVIIDGVEFAPDYMPPQLYLAQSAAAMEVSKGTELLPINTGAQIRAERIGQLSIEYFSQRGLVTTIPTIDALLAPLLEHAAALSVRRV